MALALAACGTAKPTASLSHPGCKPTTTPSLAPSPARDEVISCSVNVRQGETVKRPIAVLPRLYLLAVFVGWPNGHVEFSLISPSGKVYDTKTTDPAAHHNFQPGGESFAIDRPEAGQWRIQLVGDGVPSAGGKVYIQITQMSLSDFAPVALALASPDRGVAPVTVTFTAIVDAFHGAAITSYHWDFGDCSAVSSEQNPTHMFKSAGTYIVVLIGTDSNGESDSAVEKITVTATDHPPTATFAVKLQSLMLTSPASAATAPPAAAPLRMPPNEIACPFPPRAWLLENIHDTAFSTPVRLKIAPPDTDSPRAPMAASLANTQFVRLTAP